MNQLQDNVFITVQGPDHSGKTTIIALIEEYLRGIGCEVTLQMADAQLPEKLTADRSKLIARMQGVKVFLSEATTSALRK